jgi:hypothetical protein
MPHVRDPQPTHDISVCYVDLSTLVELGRKNEVACSRKGVMVRLLLPAYWNFQGKVLENCLAMSNDVESLPESD